MSMSMSANCAISANSAAAFGRAPAHASASGLSRSIRNQPAVQPSVRYVGSLVFRRLEWRSDYVFSTK